MNLRPLCTASVCPTMSGVIVERRDQVLTTRLSRVAFNSATFFARCSSMKGPFLIDLAILRSYAFDLRRRMIESSVRLLFRVLRPLVFQPQGEVGCRPPEVFPSPPPIGSSTVFIATPRTWGRRPVQRFRPAFPPASVPR